MDGEPGGAHRVIAVLGGKGGAGASLIALNLAVLAAATGRLVALVDAHAARAQVAALLGIEQPPQPAAAVLSRGSILAAMTPGPAGIRVCTPAQVTPALVNEHLRVLFDVTVLDVPASAGAAREPLAVAADAVVLVTGMMRPALREAGALLRTLHAVGVADGQVRVVLNRSEANAETDVPDAVLCLGREASLRLPYDPAVVATAANAGTAFVERSPEAQVSRRMRELAAMLQLVPPPAGAADAGDVVRLPGSARVGRDGRRGDRRLRFGRR